MLESASSGSLSTVKRSFDLGRLSQRHWNCGLGTYGCQGASQSLPALICWYDSAADGNGLTTWVYESDSSKTSCSGGICSDSSEIQLSSRPDFQPWASLSIFCLVLIRAWPSWLSSWKTGLSGFRVLNASPAHSSRIGMISKPARLRSRAASILFTMLPEF